LEVDEVISDCTPRVDAWDSSLINEVKKKDMISPGVFGKLQVSSDTIHKTLFLFFAKKISNTCFRQINISVLSKYIAQGKVPHRTARWLVWRLAKG
jgi:hypothetical protein